MAKPRANSKFPNETSISGLQRRCEPRPRSEELRKKADFFFFFNLESGHLDNENWLERRKSPQE